MDLRPLTPGDIPAWNALLTAAATADNTGELYSEEELAEELTNPGIDPALDTFAAVDDGTLVGYGQLIPRDTDDDQHKLVFDAITHPDHRGRGVGTALMRAMVARAETIRSTRFPDRRRAWGVSPLADDADALDLVTAAGFLTERWNVDMQVDLGTVDHQPVAEIGGLTVRGYTDADADALLEAHNAAFLDHPNFTAWSPQMWVQHVTGSRTFRPDLTFLAVDPGAHERIIGYIQSAEFQGYADVSGHRELWIAKVGTRRSHRGRGVARALLRHTLAAAKAAGYDEAGLDVDSENPTGALGVYQSVGFGVIRSRANCFLRDRLPGS